MPRRLIRVLNHRPDDDLTKPTRAISNVLMHGRTKLEFKSTFSASGVKK